MKTHMSKDPANRKIIVHREFDAAPSLVWKAWTDSDLLDQWWAPHPWVTKTKYLDFKEGGSWLYAMSGPDGMAVWSVVEFKSVLKNNRFEAVSFFCDENGKKNFDFPSMIWKNVFITSGQGTIVEVEISFILDRDFAKIIEMGFEAGFSSALGNLDELLSNK